MKLTFERKFFEYIADNPCNYSRYGLDMKFEGRKLVFSICLPRVFGEFSGLDPPKILDKPHESDMGES